MSLERPPELTERRQALVADLLAFVRAAGPTPLTRPRPPAEAAAFDALAARVLAYQVAAVPAYGRLVQAEGGTPATWRAAPLVPTELFRDVDLTASQVAPPQATFRTSGTTATAAGAPARGVRRVPDLTLYDAAMEAPFAEAVLRGGASPDEAPPAPTRWLSLIPSAQALPDSSLSHMVTTLAGRLAAHTTWAAGLDGLDAALAWAALDEAAHAREPVALLATSFALVQLLDAAPGRRVRLAAGSRAMLTGGFKGRSRTLEPTALLALAAKRLGLPGEAVADEYGMTELTSQAYAARAGEPLVAPPWLRLRVVDPASHEELSPGHEGLVAFFDLLNLDNVSPLVTSDLGVLGAAGGLTLRGRVAGAPARGCSLTAEELGVR